MDIQEALCTDSWKKAAPNKSSSDHQSFTSLDYGIRTEPIFLGYNQPSKPSSSLPCDPNIQIKIPDQEDNQMSALLQTIKNPDWDPSVMLNNLSFLEQKIHQLQNLVHLIVGRRGQVLGRPDELVAQQEQLITADLTSIIVQLISTAGSLLPSAKHGGVLFSGEGLNGGVQPQVIDTSKVSGSTQSNQADPMSNHGTEQNLATEEHESKDEDDADEGEHLPPGSYEILQLEKEEILAPHTHFCTICGKGFKRDANLRMHMRGHGDEYKSPAALAKPHKESSSEHMLIKRYSCPYSGCKRNKEHKKFQPLKTILCVKNHYKRSHCDKSYTCSRCYTKKFSVLADLKTHEKHCGRDKWLCSCGTTFSRKDKLFGHIALFQGHTPAIPLEEKGFIPDRVESGEMANKNGSLGLNFGSIAQSGIGFQNVTDMKRSIDDPSGYFSPLNFDTCSNLSGFHEFPRPPFEDSESSFSFLVPGSCNYTQKTGDLGSNDVQ